MELLYVIFTYTRPKVLKVCLDSLFGNNQLRPDKIVIINDCGTQEIRDSLYQFTKDNKIDYYCLNQNLGYGRIFEMGINIAETYEPKYCYFLESDYYFAPNGLDKVNDIFRNNEYGQNSLGWSGYDNPDFVLKNKVDTTFHEILIDNFGDDNLNWNILYKPFLQSTAFGDVYLEHCSNSCGDMYFNWQMMMEIKREFPVEYQLWKDRTCDKHKVGARNLSDGAESSGAWWLWDKYAKKHCIDRDKYSALLNIKPSVANHLNSGADSINGRLISEECKTFVGSPTIDKTVDEVGQWLKDVNYHGLYSS